jgi:hypothetical protein
MTDDWKDVGRARATAKKFDGDPHNPACTIEIGLSGGVDDRWFRFFTSKLGQRLGGQYPPLDSVNRITIRISVSDKSAIEPMVTAVDVAIRDANSDYRDVVVAPAAKAAAEAEARKAQVMEQELELDEIIRNIPDPK